MRAAASSVGKRLKLCISLLDKNKKPLKMLEHAGESSKFLQALAERFQNMKSKLEAANITKRLSCAADSTNPC